MAGVQCADDVLEPGPKIMRVTKTFSVFSLWLVLFAALPGIPGAAFAQQQEKRIALVIGNGAYAKSPLATAANDAGLIAQTLQAAGFDVVGARDLDGDTLRRSFRDFLQKAGASGPGTVAMIYLAGYGMQLAGENYFIPVDSSISHDTDVPIDGLRLGDYIRQLASLPLKASVVVLDAARQQPFVEGGPPIASGLALVEPSAHMLIAFNAAPGTIAPNEQGPYGAYAQSLAEMIRTGGLLLPEVFNRVRLRVNDLSKGAQVPWDAEKIDAPFMFFNRAPEVPGQVPPDQAAALRSKPIRDLGVQDAYAAALERDSMQGYEDFLAAYSGDPLAKRVRAIVAARREAITWLRTYRTDTAQAYWSYLRRYPRGPHAGDARRRLDILAAALEPPPAFAAIEYDVPPPPRDEIVYVDRPILLFSDPEFGFLPPPPPPIYFLPPPPPDFVVLEPPPPPIGLFILPQPFFIPMPVYVVAPVYVAPPPNNIIFANIHNTTVINNVINRPPQASPVAPGAVGGQAKGGATAPAPPTAGPPLPPAVAQRASLIQQGKLPVPPSASINPAARPATSGAPGQKAGPTAPAPANVSPNALPPGQALPKTNALPVPGTKGAPPAPPGAMVPNRPGAASGPKAPETNAPASIVGQPKGGGSALAPGAKPVAPDLARKPNVIAPPPPAKPAIDASKPIPPVTPRPQIQRAEPPRRVAPPPPPPRPAPQIARPAPPPPRMAAPPPRMAPPPPPRPAPQIARPAPPPPPPPRPAPPPPRPAAPAAAKKCPPNAPRC